MSDGIVDARTSAVFAVIAAAGVGYAACRARAQASDRSAPMAGLVAAFIFAVQMVNFPVLPGVSGHLLGGALAAILVGPYLGMLCVSIVLVVQALLFADGGLTALGTNITNMALIGVTVGYLVARALAPVLSNRRGPAALAFAAAFVATVCAAGGFVLEYALGGAVGSSVGTVTGYMLLTHALIGIGEGVITAITVTAVAAARPDLVYLLRITGQPRPHTRRLSLNQFLLGFAVVALAVAGLLSYAASGAPDGLDATTLRGCTVVEVNGTQQLDGTCIAQHAENHHLANAPLADYTVSGNGTLTGVAGVLGVAAAFAALTAFVRLVGARRSA